MNLPEVKIEDLLEAGVHFGHNVRRWNPKMEDYIFGVRNNIHIFDLRITLEALNKLRKYRELKKAENLEQEEFASIMYAKAAQTPASDF